MYGSKCYDNNYTDLYNIIAMHIQVKHIIIMIVLNFSTWKSSVAACIKTFITPALDPPQSRSMNVQSIEIVLQSHPLFYSPFMHGLCYDYSVKRFIVVVANWPHERWL